MNTNEQIITTPVVDQEEKDASPIKNRMTTRKMSNQSRASKASAATDNAEAEAAAAEEHEGGAAQESVEEKKEESPVEAEKLDQALMDQAEEPCEKVETAEEISPQEDKAGSEADQKSSTPVARASIASKASVAWTISAKIEEEDKQGETVDLPQEELCVTVESLPKVEAEDEPVAPLLPPTSSQASKK